jgi:hypothetical protein
MLENRKDIIIAALIFCLAFAIRFLFISKGPFYVDTLELALNAEATLKTLDLHYMHWAGYPLTVIMASVFIFLTRLLGINDIIFGVNFMSVVFGSLNVVIFYLLCRKILDKAGALMAALILCFLPMHIDISTFGLTHPVSIFFNLTGIYFLFLYFEKLRFNKLIFSSVFLGLGAAARLTDGLIVFVAIWLYFSLSSKNPKLSKTLLLKRIAVFLFLFGLTILIFYVPMILKTGITQFQDTLGVYYYHHSLLYAAPSLGFVAWIVGFPGLLILLAGVGYFLLERDKLMLHFLLLWFLVIFLYYGSHSCACPRYLVFSTIPLLIPVGYFISKFQRKILLYSLIFVLLVFSFFSFYRPIYFRHKYNLQESFAKFVKGKTEPSSYIIAIDEGPFIEYYADRRVLYRAAESSRESFDTFFADMDRLLEDGQAIYIISSAMYSYDEDKYFLNKLLDRYDLEYKGNHLNQDWHGRSLLESGLLTEDLYKIERKQI